MSKRSMRVIPTAIAALALALSGPVAALAKHGADDPPGHETHHKHQHRHHHHHLCNVADDGAMHQ